MASPRPSNSESAAKSSPRRLLLLASTGLVLVVAFCLVAAWLTATGTVGFGVALAAVLPSVIGLVCLREIRRAGRALRRIDGGVRRTLRESSKLAAGLDRLDKDSGRLRDAQRTTRTAVRDLRRSVAAQHASMESVVAGQLELTRAVAAGVHREDLQTQLALQLRQQQAMLNLFALAPIRDVVPTMGGWAAAADVVALLVGELLRIRPRLVVECGSGVSTLWLALTIEHHGLDCRIVSLDHDRHFAEQTRRSLRSHGVERHAEVRDAPLVPTGIEGHPTPWYDRSALSDLDGIGLVFVDGPPDATGPLVRYPAVPVLKPLLAPRATIVLDDLIRPGEKEVVDRWRLQLPDFDLQQVPLQKSAAVFRRLPSPAPG